MKQQYKGFFPMNDRTSTPDILGSIMSGGFSNKESNKEIEQDIHAAIKKAVPTTNSEDDVKEKATFNLPVSILSELEDTCHELRKLCKSKQVTKTLIVEEALKLAFADFEAKKQASRLFAKLAKHKAVKQ